VAYFFQYELKNRTKEWRACLKKGISVVLFLLILFSFTVDVFAASGDAFLVADATFNAKQYPQAKELYRDIFLNSKETAEASRALLGVAKSDYALNNYYEAGLNLKRFFNAYPASVFAGEAHYLWGQVFLHIQKIKEAEEQFNQVKGPFQQKSVIGMAELSLIRGETEKAEHLLTGIDRKIYEENNRVLYLRAMILSRQGKHDQAIQAISRIPDQALKDENIAVSKTIIFYNARKYSDAKNMLTAIIKTPSSRIEEINAKRTLLKIYEVENNQDESLKLAIDLMNYESGDELKMKIVSIYETKGDIDSALRYITYLRDKKAVSDEIEKRLRKFVEEKHPRAEEYLAKYFFYLNADSSYAIELAGHFNQQGKRDQARRLLQTAAKGKNGAEASLELAGLLISEKKYSEAKKVVMPLTTDKSFAGRASLIMYELLEREGKSGEAAEYRTRAIKALEVQKDYSRVGDLYLRSGNSAEALKNYMHAAEKGDTVSMVKAADIYYLSGKIVKARVYYKMAIDSGVKDPGTLQWADYQYGKLANNDEYLKKAEAGGGTIAEAAGLMRTDK
jgi:tetratricopeptide (TPR) repeat protein